MIITSFYIVSVIVTWFLGFLLGRGSVKKPEDAKPRCDECHKWRQQIYETRKTLENLQTTGKLEGNT